MDKTPQNVLIPLLIGFDVKKKRKNNDHRNLLKKTM